MSSFLPYDFSFLDSISKDIEYSLSSLQKALEPLQYALDEFSRTIKAIPESTKTLAEKGWYLPYDFHPVIVKRMALNIKEGKVKEVDNDMIKFLDDELINIQNQLIKKFPKRKSVLIAAFKAHKNQDYYLSIPVFFTQIEGICQEVTGHRFFKLKKNNPKTSFWVRNFKNDSVFRFLLEPLVHSGPMRQYQDPKNPNGINRHDVLHGNCIDYGNSKINSYKVLSLLNYIGETVFKAKQFLDNKIIV